MNKPHKSTTHEEMFFHIDNKATVFFRKEGDQWRASVALRSERDQFCRKTGRCVARRKYFNGKSVLFETNASKPDYTSAEVIAYGETAAHRQRQRGIDFKTTKYTSHR